MLATESKTIDAAKTDYNISPKDTVLSFDAAKIIHKKGFPCKRSLESNEDKMKIKQGEKPVSKRIK